MATAKPNGGAADVNTVLARKLPNITTKEIKSLASIIGQLNAKGLKVDDAFPEGIINPDGFGIVGNLDLKDVSKLGDLVLVAGKNIRGVTVFPQGIPAQPDFMRVTLKLGR